MFNKERIDELEKEVQSLRKSITIYGTKDRYSINKITLQEAFDELREEIIVNDPKCYIATKIPLRTYVDMQLNDLYCENKVLKAELEKLKGIIAELADYVYKED